MTNKSVRIVVATHKAYQMPTDSMYLPLHVGAKGKTDLGYRRDDTGEEHISEKNPGFCELTGLYWEILLPEKRKKRRMDEPCVNIF